MFTSILGFLDGAFKLFNGLLDWWSTQAIKESGSIEERNKSNERTLQRVQISHAVDLEPVASDKHLILSRM